MIKKLPIKRIRTEIAVGVGLLLFVGAGVVLAQSLQPAAVPINQNGLGFTPTSTLDVRSVPGAGILQITLNKQPLYSSETTLSREEANDTCAQFAFDTQYMWQEIKCTWGDAVIYHDVFVAG